MVVGARRTRASAEIPSDGFSDPTLGPAREGRRPRVKHRRCKALGADSQDPNFTKLWRAQPGCEALGFWAWRGIGGRRRLLDPLRWSFIGLLASWRDEQDGQQDHKRKHSNTGPDPHPIRLTDGEACRAVLWRRRRLRGTFTNWHEHSPILTR